MMMPLQSQEIEWKVVHSFYNLLKFRTGSYLCVGHTGSSYESCAVAVYSCINAQADVAKLCVEHHKWLLPERTRFHEYSSTICLVGFFVAAIIEASQAVIV